jgi:hypothetical protein
MLFVLYVVLSIVLAAGSDFWIVRGFVDEVITLSVVMTINAGQNW